MNNIRTILFSIFALLLLAGCNKDDEQALEPSEPGTGIYSTEEILKATGCKPTDVSDILSFKLFTNTSGTKYLYGSKKKGDIECFWVAQFNTVGDQQWEVITQDEESFDSHATSPLQIGDDRLLVSCINTDKYIQKDVYPVLIDGEGKARTKQYYKRAFYSTVYIFDGFFFCCPSNEDRIRYPDVTQYYIHLDNDGELLNLSPNMYIPQTYAVWKDKDNYIMADGQAIRKVHVTQTDQAWEFIVNLPPYKSYIPNIYFKNDSVITEYELTYDNGQIEKRSYRLEYATGKDAEQPVEYRFLDLEKEYTASDGMSITVHSIDTKDTGQDTYKYTITYSLSNKTKDKILAQGGFMPYLTDYSSRDMIGHNYPLPLYPGESSGRKVIENEHSKWEPYYYLSYIHGDPTSEIYLRTSLKWKVDR